MLFRRKTTLIDRAHTFLTKRIVESPKDNKQVQRSWRFTLASNKIHVLSDKQKLINKDNKLAEIVVVKGVQIKIYYTSIISPEDLKMLTEQIQVFGPNLIVNQEPLVRANVQKLTK